MDKEKQNWRKQELTFWTLSTVLLLSVLFSQSQFFVDVVAFGQEGYRTAQALFRSVGDFEGDPMVYVPFAIAVTLTMLGVIFFPKPPRPLAVLAVSALIGSHTLYILFRIFCTVELGDPLSAFSTLFLLAFELIIYFTSCSMYFQILFTTNRSKKADQYEQDILAGRFNPWVDVFIPTYSEPIDMLRRTIIGCQWMNYENKKIYILDDGRRSQVAALAQELGCEYIARPDNQHAKAGNINHAITKTTGEYIAMFDADCVPVQNFLSRMVGFFQEPDLGLIISAQTFYNAEMFSHNIMSLMEQSTFFRVSQRGRDKFNALLCFGTCFIVRRRAMEEIRGMPTETLSEDWATSIKLQAHGFKTYMLDEVLGSSAVAESMGEFVQQRIRWTQGTLQSLFSPTNPLTIKGLKPVQRFIHAYGILHYLTTPFYIFIIVIPLLYFLFGFAPFYVSYGQFWFFFMPFTFFNIITFSWLTQEYTSKFSSLVCESFMCIPITIAIIKTLVRPFGWRFRVTQKGVYRTSTSLNWILGGPLLCFVGLVIFGALYGYWNRHWYGSIDLFYFLFFFSVARIVFLIIGLYAAHDFPQQRKTARFERQYGCYFNNGMEMRGTTVDISETGILLKTEQDYVSDQSQVIAVHGLLDIPSLELQKVPARLIRSSKAGLAIAFENLQLQHYRKLIRLLYCQPGQWDIKGNLDKKVLEAIVKAIRVQNLFTAREQQPSQSRPGERYFGPMINDRIAKAMIIFLILATAICPNSFAQERLAAQVENIPDPELRVLAHKVLTNNHEIKTMVATLKSLKADYAINRAALYPTVNAVLVTGLHRDRQDFRDPQRNDYQLSLPASYEVDVWGRLHEKAESSSLFVEASAADQEALVITLLSELVERYYLGLGLGREIQLLGKNAQLLKEQHAIVQAQFAEGLVAKEKVLDQQLAFAAMQEQINLLLQEYARIQLGLKVLLGESPQDDWLRGDYVSSVWLEHQRKEITLAILEQRPDVVSYEIKARAAGWDVQAAREEAWPKFYLNADIQNRANKWKDVNQDNTTGWGIFASMNIPIFDGHRNQALYDKEKSHQQEWLEQYHLTLLKAQSEVAVALKNIEHQMDIVKNIEERTQLKKAQVDVLLAQNTEGLIDALTLKMGQSELIQADLDLLAAQLALVSRRVQLLRASGWGSFQP